MLMNLMLSITASDFIEIVCRISVIMDENERYLTDLDAAIGDADHGINMNRGFKSAVERLRQNDFEADIGRVFMATGMALMETVGGAAGPLYGMMLTNMATVSSGKNGLDKVGLAKTFSEGLKAVQDIGGGTMPGDKTMVDVLFPVVQELNRSSNDNSIDLIVALERALKAAKQGLKSTIPIVAKKGRASYLGERAVGHQDPGATSTYLIIKVIYEFVRGKAE
jgi:dihydroxyacetone kinase-like protein